jgi:hypothetical protein
MIDALRGGISGEPSDVPAVTLPLASYVTLVEVPPVTTFGRVAVADPAEKPEVVISPVNDVM